MAHVGIVVVLVFHVKTVNVKRRHVAKVKFVVEMSASIRTLVACTAVHKERAQIRMKIV